MQSTIYSLIRSFVMAGLLCGWTGFAETVTEVRPYTFRGFEGGLFDEPIGMTLSGGFNLDPNSVGVTNISPDGLFISITFSSPLNEIWGNYGDWTFSGLFTVNVSHGPVWIAPGRDNVASDHWIIRSTLVVPFNEGWLSEALNIFYYTSPGGIDPPSLYPPHDPLTGHINPHDFSFAFGFLDADGNGPDDGIMDYIQSVPEPSSTALIAMMIAVLVLQRRRAAAGCGPSAA